MPEEGLEPTWLHESRQILSLLRLPVSPLRRLGQLYLKKRFCQLSRIYRFEPSEKRIIMRLGFHCSVGKGLENTVKEALALGCETIQIFSRSPGLGAKKSSIPRRSKNSACCSKKTTFILSPCICYISPISPRRTKRFTRNPPPY